MQHLPTLSLDPGLRHQFVAICLSKYVIICLSKYIGAVGISTPLSDYI